MTPPTRTGHTSNLAGVTPEPSAAAAGIAGRNGAAKPNARWSAYWHLLIARTKEMQREPEVIFWVFLFPLLHAFGLGIAVR